MKRTVKTKLDDLKNLTAAILVGGLGTRLLPAVSDRPKVLAEVGERPFLSYLLDQLAGAGIRYVVLCTGYLGDQIRSAYGDNYGPLHLIYSQEPSPLGTAGALRLALPLFDSDFVLVMNGDSFCRTKLPAFMEWHFIRSAMASVLLIESTETKRYGKVLLNEDETIISFEEKNGTDGPGWINAGIYLIERSLLSTIPECGSVSLEREVFPTWIKKDLYGYRCKGHFIDIGIPEAYAGAKTFLNETKGYKMPACIK